MTDPFESVGDSLIAPARQAFPIIPSDTNDFVQFTKPFMSAPGEPSCFAWLVQTPMSLLRTCRMDRS